MDATIPHLPSPGKYLEALRHTTPLVQCITNYVAMNIAANVLLAAGASPAMVHSDEEAGEFAAIAGALTVNIGTLSPPWLTGMRQAVTGANQAGRPWVLDPVAHFATQFRRNAVAALLELRPTVIRANASEIIALAGGNSAGQGVDSRDSVELAQEAARELALRFETIIALTGETDFVTDGKVAFRVEGGSPLMPQLTALGCSLTCLVGAYLASGSGQHIGATVAALAHFAVAGRHAAREANGPGSFSWRFLDALAATDPAQLDSEASITQVAL